MNIKKRKIQASKDFDLCEGMCGSAGFFTRDDEIEYIETPLEEMIRENFNIDDNADLNLRCYIEDDNRIECDLELNGSSYTLKLDNPIDMRKIKKPSDLQKYAIRLLQVFEDEFVSGSLPGMIEGCDISASNGIHSATDINDKFTGYCYYTASNPTWGGDAWRRLEKLGGKKAQYKEPKSNGKGMTPASWVYLFPSKSVYNEFAKLLKEDDLAGFVKLQSYQEIPEDAEYKIEQYTGACTDINSATEPNPDTWEFIPVPLKALKKGAWFTLKPIAYPEDKEVYIKEDYDKAERAFWVSRCDDVSYGKLVKGDRLVYTDFIY